MQLARSYNTKRNIFFGYINKVVVSFIPFLIKAILIRKFGSGYLGLSGLFTSILQILNLAEMGIGTAIVWCMYEPIAKNDIDGICAILNFYKKVYRIIGGAIFIFGILCLPALHLLMKGEAPQGINVHFLFFLYLVDTVESYLLFAYKSTVLTAYQRIDVISKVETVTYLLQSATQVAILIFIENYYFYFSVSLVFTALKNIFFSLIVKKMFPEIRCKGSISRNTLSILKKRMYGLVIGKLTDVSRSSFDSIFVTNFMGLTFTAIYNNYYSILAGVMAYFLIILSSISSGVGNSVVMDSVEKNYRDMIQMDYIFSKLFGWASVYLVCLYQPFMQLWMGKEMVVSDLIMMSYVVYFYTRLCVSIESVYLSALGLWWEHKFVSIGEMLANMILNYWLGKYFGMIGIVFGTIISLWIISIPGSLYIIRKYYFKNGIIQYIKVVGQNVIITVGVCGVLFLIVNNISVQSLYLTLLIRFVLCTVGSPMLYWLALHRTNEYKEAIVWAKQRIKI